MQPNTDESLDRLVRETLREGADKPVAAFDPERTWARLSQELQPKPARHRLPVWWWAAGLSGLVFLLAISWYMVQPTDGSVVVVKKATPRIGHQLPITSESEVAATSPVSAQTAPVRQPVIFKKAMNKTDAKVARINSLIDSSQGVIGYTELVVIAPVIEPDSRPVVQPVAAPTRSKRRFEVMHINEYEAEEEAQPKLYRTESMVRVGSKNGQEDAAPSAPPQIVFPQRNKSN